MEQKPNDGARENLGRLIEARRKELDAVTHALTLPQTPIDTVRLKEQFDGLVAEMQALEEKLRGLGNGAFGTGESKPQRIWNILHRRNPNFTGRDDLLAALRAALVSGRPAAVTQAVAGLGGVGKTQLAVEYCYRHRDEYETVWWLRSEEPSTLAGDYASLGIKAGFIAPDERDQAAAAARVREWLEQTTGWLLVFDNANNPDELAAYLPSAAAGHTVITSRYRDWGEIGGRLDVPTFPEEVGARFLLDRTGSADEKTARAISRFVGGLALALEHAGAYVARSGCTLADYLAKLQATGIAAFKSAKAPNAYHSTVLNTWTVAMQQAGETRGARDVLALCAFLAPDDIPRDLFAPLEAFDLDAAIAALRDYSLLETGNGTVTIHRLVQAVVRGALAPDDARQAAEATLMLVRVAYPFDSDDHRFWPRCKALDAHVVAVAAHAEALGVESVTCGALLNQYAGYRWAIADNAGAKVAFERALRIDEAALGTDHPGVATCLSNLGNVLRNLGDYAGAKAALERSLRIDEAAFGPDHPTVAIRLSNLGNVLFDFGDYAGAKAALERALRIDEAALGPEHPDVAACLGNLGPVLRALGDYPGAKVALERALRIDEAALGLDHPEVATDLSNLGNVLSALGDYVGAKAALERALRIGEAALGPDHPTVAIRHNNLAHVLLATGDLAGARDGLLKALDIWVPVVGEAHPNVVAARESLAYVDALIAAQGGANS
jgi:tetratricopeptide (TPR) repeat protein